MRVFALFAAMLIAPGVHAAPHQFRVHSNPTIRIRSITQGLDGLIWLAAEDGVYRFDGFHFHKMPAYPLPFATHAASTTDGVIWFAGPDGLVKYAHGRFNVVRRDAIGGLVNIEAFIYFVAEGQSLHRMRADEFTSPLREQVTYGELTVDATGAIWDSLGVSTYRAFAHHLGSDEVVYLDARRDKGTQVARDGLGRIWLASELSARVVVGTPPMQLHRNRSVARRNLAPLVPGRKGQLWFIGETVNGVSPEIRYVSPSSHDPYPPTAGFEDSAGRLWVARAGLGLIEWIPEPIWERWESREFGTAPVTLITRTNSGDLIAAPAGGALHRFDPQRRTWHPFHSRAQVYAGLLPLSQGSFLAAIRDHGLARLSAEGEIVETLPNPQSSNDEYRELVQDRSGAIWAANKWDLFRVTGSPGHLKLEKQILPGAPKLAGALDIELDADGAPWVCYDGGIAFLAQEQWQRIRASDKIEPVRSCAIGRDEIWYSRRTRGPFTRLRRRNGTWHSEKFDHSASLPEDSFFIKRDTSGWVWRGSRTGVYVSDGIHVLPQDWLHLHPANGLVTNETDIYGFFEDTDKTIWISGLDGITHLTPDSSWFGTPKTPPQVTRVAVGERTFFRLDDAPRELPENPGTLQFDIGSTSANHYRKYPFQYRLLPVEPNWSYTSNGNLVWKQLPPGNYTLEVAHTGAAESRKHQFRIGPPMISISSYGWLWPSAVLAGGGILLIIRRRPLWFDSLLYRTRKRLYLARQVRPGPTPDEFSLPPYRIENRIHDSDFSTVWEATHEGRRVAIKIIKEPPRSRGVLRDRFTYEVASLRSLDHRSIVPIYDSGVSKQGDLFLVMPLLAGLTLRTVIAQGTVAPVRASRLIHHLASALQLMHSRGIVHRDIKPENIVLMRTENEEIPVIIDFGTAGLRGASGQIVQTSLPAGSFHYLAPELLLGRYSAATDIYSFAIVILEMLTGKRLADLSSTPVEDRFSQDVAALLKFTDALRFAQHLAAALHPEPTQRPQEVDTWAKALLDHLPNPL